MSWYGGKQSTTWDFGTYLFYYLHKPTPQQAIRGWPPYKVANLVDRLPLRIRGTICIGFPPAYQICTYLLCRETTASLEPPCVVSPSDSFGPARLYPPCHPSPNYALGVSPARCRGRNGDCEHPYPHPPHAHRTVSSRANRPGRFPDRHGTAHCPCI